MMRSTTQHVVPINDYKDHIPEGDTCWCHPDYDEQYDMYIHHSMDGREAYETGERKPH